MYTTGFQTQAPDVALRSGEEQDILKTKRHDAFASPSRNFSSYFKDTTVLGRS